MLDEELGLVLGRRVDAIEMVGSAGESVFTGLIEIVLEILVDLRGAFSGLDHDEAHGELVYGSFIL